MTPASGRRPDFFIIGARKSGTTSMYEYLRGHPEVYLSPVKEPHFFSPDVNPEPTAAAPHRVSEDEYLALFSDARDEKRVGEASPRYITSAVAPTRLHQFAPDARVIAMFRDPIEVLQALHNERVAIGLEPIADFTEALAADEDRLDGKRLPPRLSPLASAYRPAVRFGEQLQRWTDELGRDRVHVIVLDDLKADPATTFERTLEFLDVDPSYRPTSFAARNTSHRRRGGLFGALLRGPHARFAVHTLMPRLIGSNRSKRLAQYVRQSRLFRRKHVREPMDPELRRQLQQELEPDLRLLSEQVGRDLVALWWRP